MTDEERARAEGMLDRTLKALTPDQAKVQEAEKYEAERQRKLDAHFARDFVEMDGRRISRTMAKKLGYAVGDEDGDRNAE